MKLRINKKNKAFTLTEIVVAVFIIALIYSLISASLRSVKRNNRDTQRVIDMKELQIILEEYYRNEGSYPSQIIFGEALVGEETGKLYKVHVAKNPVPASKKCASKEYYYENVSYNDSYILKFCLEEDTSDLWAGVNCLSPTGANNPCYDF